MSAHEFSTTLREIELRIDGQDYKLIEFTGKVREKYLDQMANRAKTNAAGDVIGVKSHSGLHSSLITLCLHDSSGSPVKEDVINSWPATMQRELFEMCTDLNGLGGQLEASAKND